MKDNFLNFKTAKSQLQTLYGISLSDDEFEEIALYGWDQINNKRYQIYVYDATVDSNGIAYLPCNIEGENQIEAVLSKQEDAPIVTSSSPGIDLSKTLSENYSEAYKSWNHKGFSRRYHSGSLIHYEFLGDSIKINYKLNSIAILYRGILMDDDGLPYINKKERDAICAFCAFAYADKEAFGSKDKNQEYFSQKYENRWKVLKGKARCPISINQNQFDEIMDVKFRWDRKRYNLGYKPTNR